VTLLYIVTGYWLNQTVLERTKQIWYDELRPSDTLSRIVISISHSHNRSCIQSESMYTIRINVSNQNQCILSESMYTIRINVFNLNQCIQSESMYPIRINVSNQNTCILNYNQNQCIQLISIPLYWITIRINVSNQHPCILNLETIEWGNRFFRAVERDYVKRCSVWKPLIMIVVWVVWINNNLFRNSISIFM